MSNDLTGAASKAAKHLLRRPSALNPLNAFIKHKQRAQTPGPEQGNSIPNPRATAAVKDNIVTTDSTTTCASGFLQDYTSPFEASVVRQLRENNYDIKGKTNMDEFGMGSHSMHSYFGPVHNKVPFTQRSAGGSSGGSAVAVAMGSRDFALGTDTGGSVRLPAAYTGVVGFKPSYGKISRWGVVPYANSLDTVGIFAPRCSKALRQCQARLSSLHDPRDPTSFTDSCRKRLDIAKESRGLRWKEGMKLRIGVPIEYNIKELKPVVRYAWRSVLQELQNHGHVIVPVSLPSTKHALSAYYILAAAEAASNLSKYDGVRYGTPSGSGDGIETVLYDSVRGNGFGDEVKRRILLGSYTLSSEAIDNYFVQAQKVRRLVQRDFDRIFAMPNPLHPQEQFNLSDLDEGVQLEDKLGPTQIDILICPAAPTPPPLLKQIEQQPPIHSYINDVFTVPASLAGLPAISVPVVVDHRRGNVSFAGIQVVGQFWDDNLVIRAGHLIESSTLGTKPKKMPKELSKIRKTFSSQSSAIVHYNFA